MQQQDNTLSSSNTTQSQQENDMSDAKKLSDALKLNEQHIAEIKQLNDYNRKLLEENNKLYSKLVAVLGNGNQQTQQTQQQTQQQNFINKLKGGY